MDGSETTLRALAHGDLRAWQGIPEGADAAWVRAALGDGVADSGGGLLTWHGGVTGPEGLLVWLTDDRVELIELPQPDVPLDATEPLGEPEFVAETPWSRVGLQRAWPSRGLAVHASSSGTIRVMAFAPMAPEAFAEHRFARMGRPPRRP